VPTPRKISQIKPLLTNLAQTSHYQVNFGGLSGGLRSYLFYRGIDPIFIGESVGLLCSSASLPGSSFATTDIVGNFPGVTEKFAHTRAFTQIDLEFYVDKDYRALKFLEHWMEYISGASTASPYNKGYFFRMQYPENYKTDQTKIVKFERDYNRTLEYTFYGLFPLALNSIVVTYNTSEILKTTVSFNYDRYVCGRTLSVDVFKGTDNNRDGVSQQNIYTNSSNTPLIYRTGASLGNESGVRATITPPGSVIPTIVDPYSYSTNNSASTGKSIDIGTRRVF